LVPASLLFTNLKYMDSPVWNLSSQSPIRDDAAVSSPPVSATTFDDPIVQPQSSGGVAPIDETVEPVTKSQRNRNLYQP
jgi:hypothetical protein